MPRSALPLIFLLCAASAGAATRYAPEPQREACRLWEQVEQAVWDGKADRKEATAKFIELWPMLTAGDPIIPSEHTWQWVFPLPGHNSDNWSVQSYMPALHKFYDGPKAKGYPAIAIYARDRKREALDDRTGKPIPVVSATDGYVVSARKFWQDTDTNPLGIYLCIFSPTEKRFFYYAHLGKTKVGVSQLVNKGDVIGWLGRTGKKVVERNRGTHLRFEVHSWDEGLFYPVFPGRMLKGAEHLKFPLEGPDYTKKRKN